AEKPCQRRSGSRGSGFDKQPEPAECRQSRRDLLFTDGNNVAFRATHRTQDFGDSNRSRCGDPVRDGWPRRECHESIFARLPSRGERRAIRSLYREESRPLSDLAAPLELVEAALEAEDVTAVAGWDEDIVWYAKTELLPQLEGEGLRAFDKI